MAKSLHQASVRATKRNRRLEEHVLADPADDGLLEQYAEATHAADKRRRDAKTHKDRLKRLEQEGLK